MVYTDERLDVRRVVPTLLRTVYDPGSDHFTFCNTLRFAAPSYILRPTLHFAALYILQLYIVPLHFTFCSTLHFATLHCATLLYVLQHFTICGPTRVANYKE